MRRILSIDTSAAQALPGVACALTAEDVPGLNGFGLLFPDMPVLCGDRVRYLGDSIALVAAETDELAYRARDLIEVEYEVLPLVIDPHEALKPDAPLLHDNGNLCSELTLGHGDVAAGFAEADFVFECIYQTGMQEHIPLETEAGAAYYDDEGRLTVVAGGQNPFSDRFQISRALDLPEDSLRVLNPMMGGSFGTKEEITVQIHLALVTLRTQRPCRLMWDRDESIIAGFKRHPFYVHYKTGVKKDGRLTAAEVKFIADTGAYASLGPAVLTHAVEQCCGPYYFPNTNIIAKAVYTNNGVSGAFRGFGNPQVVIGLERLMNTMADAVGMDRIAFRRLNTLQSGQIAGPGHKTSGVVSLPRVLDALTESELLKESEAFKTLPNRSSRWKRRGIGLASTWQVFGLGAGLPRNLVDSEARIELQENGRYHLHVGAPDMGEGNATAFVQIAAHELGCATQDIDLTTGDSLGPDSGPTNASRTVYAVGSATLRAAVDLREKILGAAAQINVQSVSLRLEGSNVRGDGQSIPLADLAVELGPLQGVGRFHPNQPDPIAPGLPHEVYAYAAQIALVEVDVLTGEIDVLQIENYLDAGHAINPQGVMGQSEGGIAQGIGYALLEEVLLKDGHFLNPKLSTYIIPSITDVPSTIKTTILEEPEPLGPYGARGIAEICITPTAAAILNAVQDAIGIYFDRVPVTPEMILEALDDHTEE